MNKADKPLWELNCVTKEFPGIRAVDNLSIKIFEGEIHGLVGGNGSGKSTLIKCLSGVYQPDHGEFFLNGVKVTVNNSLVAKSLGVATIYQEFSLVPTLSVAENVFLGRLPRKAGNRLVDWRVMRERTEEVLGLLEVKIDPNIAVRHLSVAEQQLVEIAKALSTSAKLLIMDEPTAALGMSEIQRLHEIVKRMAEKGYAIIYISHRLDEIIETVDCVTIMKDGRVVGSCGRDEMNISYIVNAMVGEEVEEHYPKEHNSSEETMLEVKGLYSEKGANGADFYVKKGEVFGLGGMMGSGRTETVRALFGADRIVKGQILLYGHNVIPRSPKDAIRSGMAFVTENRKTDGLFFNMEAPGNITIAGLKFLLKRIFLDLKKEKEISISFIEKMRVHKTAMIKSVKLLSGGNQQKVIIARWLFTQADLFILDEPTQGIDVAAKVEVYKLINELTSKGKSVILISSDIPELLAISDRIGIVRKGRIEKMTAANDLTQADIIQSSIRNNLMAENKVEAH